MIRLGRRVGDVAHGIVIDDARLTLIGEGPNDEIHRDLLVEASVRREHLGLVVLRGIPDDADPRSPVALEVDLLDLIRIDDLLIVPANASGKSQVRENRPLVLKIKGQDLMGRVGVERGDRRVVHSGVWRRPVEMVIDWFGRIDTVRVDRDELPARISLEDIGVFFLVLHAELDFVIPIKRRDRAADEISLEVLVLDQPEAACLKEIVLGVLILNDVSVGARGTD